MCITEFLLFKLHHRNFYLQFRNHIFSAENILHILFIYTPGLLNNYLGDLTSKSFFLEMPKIFLLYLKNALKSSNFCINFYVHQLDTPSHREPPEILIISQNFLFISVPNLEYLPLNLLKLRTSETSPTSPSKDSVKF